MNKNKWITMAAVLALSASMAFAGPHGGGRHGKHARGGEFGQRMAEKLNLTEAQKAQLKAQHQAFREANKAFFENAHETRRQFREAKKAGDTARLEALKPTMEAQRAQMQQLHEQQKQQFLSVLTPEQRTQFEALKAEREARRSQRRDRD